MSEFTEGCGEALDGWDRTRAAMRQINAEIRSRQTYQGRPRQLRSGVWMDACGQVAEGGDRCGDDDPIPFVPMIQVQTMGPSVGSPTRIEFK